MRKIAIFSFATYLSLLNSCTTEQVSIDNPTEQVENAFNGITENGQAHVCLDVSELLENENLAEKALVKAKLWENGQTITIKFLGGTTSLQNRVMEKAREWEQYANLKFEVITTGNADIRISFNQDGSSWSYIGTDAARINQNNATMNFGWFTDNTSDNEIQRTTLHEFGHALGAIHEHSSPDADIQWDVAAVYAQYELYGWSQQQVDNNLFSKYDSSLVTNSQYDPESIMHYPINSNLTLNNFSVGYNTELSDLDKEFIGITYPFEATTAEENEEEEAEEVVEETNSRRQCSFRKTNSTI